jgi:hypothetical protein
MTADITELNSTWAVLARALTERRPVRARYHGHDRILCPHLLGWKHGRPKVLAYQTGGTTSTGSLPPQPDQRWRSLYIDQIDQAAIAREHPWQTPSNYTPDSNCVDQIAFAISEP